MAQKSWDSHFNVLYYHFSIEEMIFWKQNIQRLNKIKDHSFLTNYQLQVFSGASNSGIGTCFKMKGVEYFIYKNFSGSEKCGSSTWRGLEAIYYYLCSLPKFLNNNSLFWHTDNFAGSLIVESGRNKPKL